MPENPIDAPPGINPGVPPTTDEPRAVSASDTAEPVASKPPEPPVVRSRALIVMDIAGVCHEANRAYCYTLGDFSQPSWERAPQWQIDSAIAGVEFHLANPSAGPEASHNSWMAEKLAAGWMYGEVKDAEKRTHPCLISFDDLPIGQRMKDYLFHGIVRAFVEARMV